MMEEIIKIYSNNPVNYRIDNNLEVLLDIKENKYDIPSKHLFKMAARKNLKREFLFVSRVIGKHLPMHPQTLNIIGAILARSWAEKRENICFKDIKILVDALNYLKENEINETIDEDKIKEAVEITNKPIELKNKTLFIGFAETATGLAHAVFNSFSNAAFIHTTREDIKSIKPSVFFKEEHSHAVDHQLYPIDPLIFDKYDDIVLIDDELTTGKTALNLIDQIKGKSFGIISILDWRDIEQEKFYESKNIKVCSLIKGNISHRKTGDLDRNDYIEQVNKEETVFYREVAFSKGNYIEGYLLETGRFGCTSHMHNKFKIQAKEIGEDLKKLKAEGNCLCVGTEEFIYIPCLISCYMGKNVFFQSTTRSPIYARNIEDYGINKKISFKTQDNIEISKYLYNIPHNFYSQVFMFTEKPLTKVKKEEFARIFYNYNIRNVVFVNGEDSSVFSGSYSSKDVVFLLKNINGMLIEKDNEFRENAIQSGTHYSEMLPIEYQPSKEYMDIFYETLENSKNKLAYLTAILSQEIIKKRGENIVLVSLARAGTPIGILIKRYILYRYNIDLDHYSISIIRDKGIDINALNYIIKKHPDKDIQFIDGWTGKGVIQNTLIEACDKFYEDYNIKLNADLAVLSDPAYCTETFATREDFLIPSACLNSTVSGLVSRTVFNKDIIGEGDFHGAKYYCEMKNADVSNFYIDEITSEFEKYLKNIVIP